MFTGKGGEGGDPLLDRIPWWGIVIGWILAATAAIQIPLWILITVYKQSGSLSEVSYSILWALVNKNLIPANKKGFQPYQGLGTSRSS